MNEDFNDKIKESLQRIAEIRQRMEDKRPEREQKLQQLRDAVALGKQIDKDNLAAYEPRIQAIVDRQKEAVNGISKTLRHTSSGLRK
jgi:hypothetical protein